MEKYNSEEENQKDSVKRAERLLSLYTRLCEGEIISIHEEKKKFRVDRRTVQRDMEAIKIFLAERKRGNWEIELTDDKRGYILCGSQNSKMSNGEILAVSKILLESRAFTKEEMFDILDKMLEGCVPFSNRDMAGKLIANEKHHYVELQNKKPVYEKIWELGVHIRECNLLEITYDKASGDAGEIKRIIEPVAVLFSEYYFYLHAFIVEEEHGKFEWKYDSPAIFRLDRIKNIKKTGKKFKIPDASRFKEGEFRKMTQFMYPGERIHLRLKYYGEHPEPILDRLPTAVIKKQEEDGYLIEAEVYGKGIIMWLLSQGSKVEVLGPKSLREEMRKSLQEVLGRYE